MIHLENHPHSFVKDNVVINTAVFNEHNHELIDTIKQSLEADWVQCNCDYLRFITVDATWNGTDFVHPDGTVIPREPMPEPTPEELESEELESEEEV
jgi:hypothetical protein